MNRIWNHKIRELRETLLLLLFFVLISGSSLAENGPTGNVTVGILAVEVDEPSYKFGEYSGITDDSVHLISNADLFYSKDFHYLDLKAENAGLENSRFKAEIGLLGYYRLQIGYDSIPHLISGTARTPFMGAGGSILTLPSGFDRGSTTDNSDSGAQTQNLTNLSGNLKDISLQLKRETWNINMENNINDKLNTGIYYEKETRKGTKSLNGVLGLAGNNTRSVILPEPVDYDTDNLTASLQINSDKAFLKAEYFLSDFHNAHDSITWDNPFNVTDYPSTARTSLPPDNRHYRIGVSSGLNLSSETRVNLIAEYSAMIQDDPLLPYSNNPASTTANPLPRATAEAEIAVKHLTFDLSSRPNPKLGLNIKYRYYGTENKTERTLFQYIKNDSGGAQADIDDDSALYSLPYDYIQNEVEIDASYYLISRTSLKAGYDYNIVSRDYREIEKTKEQTYSLSLHSQYFSNASFGLDYSYAEKRAEDPYKESNVYDSYHTSEYINTISNPDIQFDNHPLLRKYDIAEKNRSGFASNLTYHSSDNLSLGIYYNYTLDDYLNSDLGLRENKINNYTVDFTYFYEDYASLYGFYTGEDIGYKQRSRQFNGFGAKAGQSADPDRDWEAIHDEDVKTLGFGANIGFIENRLILSAEYSFSAGTTGISLTAGSALPPPEKLPDLKTRINNVNTTGRYRIDDHIEVGIRYSFENYDSDNWQIENVDPGSTVLSEVLTLSGASEDYEAHTGMIFLSYYFGVH